MLVPKWWFVYGPSTFIELPFSWKKAFSLLMYVYFVDAVKYMKEPLCRKGLIIFSQITCKHPLDLMQALWEIWPTNLCTWISLAQIPFHFLVHVWLAPSSVQCVPALETFEWLRKGMPGSGRGRGSRDWIPYSGLSSLSLALYVAADKRRRGLLFSASEPTSFSLQCRPVASIYKYAYANINVHPIYLKGLYTFSLHTFWLMMLC